LELRHEEKIARNVLEVTPLPRRYKKAKSNIENKNAAFLAKITHMEKNLLDKLMHGLDHDFAAMHDDGKEEEEREESAEAENKMKDEAQEKEAKMEEKSTAL
jgi:hypothetical protein